MFATIGKTVITTLAVSAAIDFITKPRTSNALDAGLTLGQHLRNIPTHVVDGAKAARDFVHGLVDGVRGTESHEDEATLAAREHANAYYKEQAQSKRFAEHA
jgi:hypothetical protein